MKIGVLSDIHSNYRALKACIEYMEKEECDEYILLGDYVSDCPYPQKTMELIRTLRNNHVCTFLKGNRENYLLSQKRVRDGLEEGPKWIPNSACGNLLYTYENLTDEDFEFFSTLPIFFVYEREGYPAITICHGSPASDRELLEFYEPDKVYTWLDRIDTDYLLCGHTHYQGQLDYHGKKYMNSGTVGIPIGLVGRAQCMILRSEDIFPGDGGLEASEAVEDVKGVKGVKGVKDSRIRKWIPEFLEIPYNHKEVIEEMFTSGLYDMGHWFINSNIQVLATGVDNSAKMVQLAAELSNGQVWPHIDEKYFLEAAQALGIPEYGDL